MTAISQQHLYDVYPPIDYDADIRAIVEYQSSTLNSKITHITSYCVDIAILEDNTPYFIEINSFGREYSSGSSLFGWEQDRDILYGDNVVYVRYTTPHTLGFEEEGNNHVTE